VCCLGHRTPHVSYRPFCTCTRASMIPEEHNCTYTWQTDFLKIQSLDASIALSLHVKYNFEKISPLTIRKNTKYTVIMILRYSSHSRSSISARLAPQAGLEHPHGTWKLPMLKLYLSRHWFCFMCAVRQIPSSNPRAVR
jgi:hypothetical protein